MIHQNSNYVDLELPAGCVGVCLLVIERPDDGVLSGWEEGINVKRVGEAGDTIHDEGALDAVAPVVVLPR